MLIPVSASWLPTYSGTSTPYEISIAFAKKILEVLMAIIPIEKLSGARVLHLLKQSDCLTHLRLAGARDSTFLAADILVSQILLPGLVRYFFIPQVQEACLVSNTAMPSLSRPLSIIHFEGFELQPMVLFADLVWLLARGPLLMLLDRNGDLPISNIEEF